MFEIRIYNEYDKYGTYNDYVYYPENDEKDADCLIKSIIVKSKKELIEKLKKLIEKYEGFTFCIRTEDGSVGVGGVFDHECINMVVKEF